MKHILVLLASPNLANDQPMLNNLCDWLLMQARVAACGQGALGEWD
jgi:hypothetical protein